MMDEPMGRLTYSLEKFTYLLVCPCHLCDSLATVCLSSFYPWQQEGFHQDPMKNQHTQKLDVLITGLFRYRFI